MKWLPDGIYELSPTCLVHETEPFYEEDEITGAAKIFVEQNPDSVIACAYQATTLFILSEEPEKFKGGYQGGGFNYGTTSILENCPKRILILAEDD